MVTTTAAPYAKVTLLPWVPSRKYPSCLSLYVGFSFSDDSGVRNVCALSLQVPYSSFNASHLPRHSITPPRPDDSAVGWVKSFPVVIMLFNGLVGGIRVLQVIELTKK